MKSNGREAVLFRLRMTSGRAVKAAVSPQRGIGGPGWLLRQMAQQTVGEAAAGRGGAAAEEAVGSKAGLAEAGVGVVVAGTLVGVLNPSGNIQTSRLSTVVDTGCMFWLFSFWPLVTFGFLPLEYLQTLEFCD